MSFNIVGIGEVLWDLLPDGPQLGGAPANFACHAQALGGQALVVSRVGNDPLGHQVLERFQRMNLADAGIQFDDQHPTGTATVTLSGEGVPQFTIHENVAWDRLAVTQAAQGAVRAASAVCFGSLAQRAPVSRAAIQQLLAAAPAEALRIFDINLRQRFYSRDVLEQSLRLANVLKLNDDELAVLAEMFALRGGVRLQIQRLAESFALKLVVVTCGPRGSLIYSEGCWSERQPEPMRVVDTVGAGDSFTAALTMGLLSNMELDEVHSIATEVAGYVCSKAGATPSLPEMFRRRFMGGQMEIDRSLPSKFN